MRILSLMREYLSSPVSHHLFMKNVIGYLVLILCLMGILCAGCTTQQTFPVVPDQKPGATTTFQQARTGEPGDTVNVRIRDSSFDPAIITVKAGTQVIWTNEDTIAHRVTYTNKTAGSFESPGIDPGKVYAKTFYEPGRYEYADSQHSFMTGTIIVV